MTRFPSFPSLLARPLPRGAAIALLGCVAIFPTACGGDDAPPTETPTPDGRDPDEVVPPEREAPEFGGVKSATVDDDFNVLVNWSPGRDAQTEADHLVYYLYLGEDDRPVSIERPWAVTLPGARSHKLTNLPAGSYRIVVRAVDEHGNIDENRSSVAVRIPDQSAPEFAGITGALSLSSDQILVQWKPALDNVSAPHLLRYRVYCAFSRSSVFDGTPQLTAHGATSLQVHVDEETCGEKESGEKDVWFGVRALDENDLEDENLRVTSTTPHEGVPPTFSGLSDVIPHTNGVELSWDRATDDVTAQAAIVYRIYVAKESGSHNFLAPYVITPPGVAHFVLTDLDPNQQYYFVVQAQDLAGNRDKNQQQRGIKTREADTSPPDFEGLASAEAFTPRSATLRWSQARDDRTPESSIGYDIYLSESSGKQDFGRPSDTSEPGASSWVLLDLKPDTEYFAVVRARDAAGLHDDNLVERKVSTPALSDDEEAPRLSGNLQVRTVPSEPSLLQVAWSGTEDDAGLVRAHLCASVRPKDCDGEEFWSLRKVTSDFGGGEIFLSNLSARSLYWVSLRLEDENGNRTTTVAQQSGMTATSFETDVMPLLEKRCSGTCHDYDNGYGALVNVPSMYEDLYLVDPASVQNSYLLRTLRPPGDTNAPFSEKNPAEHDEDRMPSDETSYLDAETESILFDWVAQGAFDN